MADYRLIRRSLEIFLPFVGQEVLQLRRYAKDDPLFSRLKEDKTIVTKADEMSEDLIRNWIQAEFPFDGIRGEERQRKDGDTSRTWIIDPIDGTYNFNNFGRRFGISVGILEEGRPQCGVIHYPAEEITLSASEKGGAFLNKARVMVAEGAKDLNQALILGQAHPFSDDERFYENNKKQLPLLKRVRSEDLDWCYVNSFRNFLFGHASSILHCGATPYDIAGAVAIARELNLFISGYDGNPLDFSKDIIPIVISKYKRIHYMILEMLNAKR